jgi:riboflavin kinase/FMN adenylyltransferase
MLVFHRTPRLPEPCRGAGVAIGNFDGVHLGHQAVLRAAASAIPDRPFGVITFEPHPREVLQPERAPARLTPLPRKLARLREAGAGFVLVLRFNRELIATPPASFIERIVVERAGARAVAVGRDFRFGHGRAGDGALLERLGAAHGFATHVVDPVTVDGEVCSSTRIRELLGNGRVAEAAALLGRPHAVLGRVVEGDRRGRQIGFPTANLALRGRRPVLPAVGVYAVEVRLRPGDGTLWPGVANLGYRPTFAGRELRLEVHLLDRGRDLYGHQLEVGFVARLRGELRFDGIEALRAQIARDVAQARAVHGLDPGSGRMG